jgi:TPR repeat protein
MSRLTNKAKADALFCRAEREEERGNLNSAFRLTLAAAKLGDVGAQINVGNYYDDAKGVRRNREAALYWYTRAYRRGYSSAAHNIGVLWRKEKQFKRALAWFLRAVKLGDAEANLEIGKHYLHIEGNPRKAISYLQRVRPSGWVTEAGVEESAKLLKEARKALGTSRISV